VTTEPLRLMAVHAHPDDESSKGAAATARYAAEGVEVLVVTCTGGERGDVLNPQFGEAPSTPEAMAVVRQAEMAAAVRALGVRQHWLGFVDSGLPQGDPLPPVPEGSFSALPIEEAAAPLVQLVREFRPHVMTTYDPSGGYPHPDHMMCNRVSVEAFGAAADEARYPSLGPAWTTWKLYYNHDFSLHRIRTMHEAILGAGLESPTVTGSRAARRARFPSARSRPGSIAPSTSRRGTRPCVRMPPRSTRTGSSSRFRATSRRGSGRSRSTSWPCRSCRPPSRRMISSPASVRR